MTPDRVPELVSGRIATRLRESLLVTPRLPQPGEGAREAAVLILLCPAQAPVVSSARALDSAAADLAVVLVRKSAAMRSHAGQVAFPGGRREPDDADAAATALREAGEEAGIAASTVGVVAQLPPLGLGPSNHHVTPVLGWWHSPASLQPDGVEVVAAAPVSLAALADPAHRVAVRHPAVRDPAAGAPPSSSSPTWPGYDLPADSGTGWFVWGFTAWLLTALLTAAGADADWDRSRVVDVPMDQRGSTPR